MTVSDIVVLLEEVKDFLRDIGCGDIYGTLGHDAGGVLSHDVLFNDPHCKSFDQDGKLMTCQLNPKDKRNITNIYDDLNHIIDKGQSQEFVDRLGDAIEHLKRKA